jgi:hypothetical protein
MSMVYVECWSLKLWRTAATGIIWPARSVSSSTYAEMYRQDFADYLEAKCERDRPLSPREQALQSSPNWRKR